MKWQQCDYNDWRWFTTDERDENFVSFTFIVTLYFGTSTQIYFN